ncbi:hypothetical protein E2562_003058 [Oryza meyeriana var. granulata]|uniref:Uncharacterized protein n=1 Tax=Oryza meyeriana var. granulata TaxID=110450 RepID=A0A6G1DE07_9ORYZ|nr:hypothetical protein E2562_003058 [Oryza meyeriana var. granulata]
MDLSTNSPIPSAKDDEAPAASTRHRSRPPSPAFPNSATASPLDEKKLPASPASRHHWPPPPRGSRETGSGVPVRDGWLVGWPCRREGAGAPRGSGRVGNAMQVRNQLVKRLRQNGGGGARGGKNAVPREECG